MLLEKKEKLVSLFARVLRGCRSAILLLCGSLLVVGISLMILQFGETDGPGVFSSSASAQEGADTEMLAGLMGVVNGVSTMEHYSDEIRMNRVVDSGEEVLAGASRVDRRVIRRAAFLREADSAGQVGDLAQQTVRSNLMPEEEYDTLLHIVEAEATGGDITSKMMVAGVVLNRVEDPCFPDTISGVVFEKDQFSPVSDGRFYSCEVTEDTIEAVARVLSGENCSEGALYFVARDSAADSELSWFDEALTWLFYYGGHDYYTFTG